MEFEQATFMAFVNQPGQRKIADLSILCIATDIITVDKCQLLVRHLWERLKNLLVTWKPTLAELGLDPFATGVVDRLGLRIQPPNRWIEGCTMFVTICWQNQSNLTQKGVHKIGMKRSYSARAWKAYSTLGGNCIFKKRNLSLTPSQSVSRLCGTRWRFSTNEECKKNMLVYVRY